MPTVDTAAGWKKVNSLLEHYSSKTIFLRQIAVGTQALLLQAEHGPEFLISRSQNKSGHKSRFAMIAAAS
jgi:hypothetical protein